MAYTPPQKDLILFVGGLGDTSGKHYGNGGGCTKAAFDTAAGDWSKFITSFGGPLVNLADVDVTVTNNGSGKVRVTKESGFPADLPVGILARIWDLNGDYSDYNGYRFEVIAVDGSSNWIDLELDYIIDDADISIKVGGAINQLSELFSMPDSQDIDYSRTIYTTINEGFGGKELEYGGKRQTNSWLSIVGCDNTGGVLTSGNYIEYDLDNGVDGLFNFSNVENVRVVNIKAKNAGSSGSIFRHSPDVVNRYVSLINCKVSNSTGTYAIELNSKAIVYVEDFVLDTISGTHGIFNSGGVLHIKNSYLKGNNKILVYTDGGTTIIENTVFDTVSKGVLIAGDGLVIAHNNSMYKISEAGMHLNTANSRLIEDNNIFHVLDTANDYAIQISGGSVLHSGYSCANATTNGLLNEANLGVCYVGGSLNNTDPEFVNPASGDFCLKTTSACLNSGKPTLNNGDTSMGAWQRSQNIACQFVY